MKTRSKNSTGTNTGIVLIIGLITCCLCLCCAGITAFGFLSLLLQNSSSGSGNSGDVDSNNSNPQGQTQSPFGGQSSSSSNRVDPNESVPMQNFSLNNANTTSPSDVLEELNFFIGGGGNMCEDEYNKPDFDPKNTDDDKALLEDISLVTCGWETNKDVLITVTRPDGSQESFTETPIDIHDSAILGGAPFYAVESKYKTHLSDPEGKYTFAFLGDNVSVEHSVFVRFKPNVIQETQDVLLVYGFQPYERIRIFDYKGFDKPGARFSGWQEYQVNENGQLRIQLADYNDYFFIVGDISGYVGSNNKRIKISTILK